MSTVDKLVDRQKTISRLTEKGFIDEYRLRRYLETYLPQFTEEDQHVLGFLLLGTLNSPYLDWALEDHAWVVAETLLPKNSLELTQLDALRLWSRLLTSTNTWQPIAGFEEFWGLNGHPLLGVQEFEDAFWKSIKQSQEDLLRTVLDFFNAQEESPKDPRTWHQLIWEARSNYKDKKTLKRHEFVVRAIIEQPSEQTEPLIAHLVNGHSKKEILSKFGITGRELGAYKAAVERKILQLDYLEKEHYKSFPRSKKRPSRDIIAETQFDPFQRS